MCLLKFHAFFYFPKRCWKSTGMKKIEPEIIDSNEHENCKLVQVRQGSLCSCFRLCSGRCRSKSLLKKKEI